jgi:hypothetical protein
MSGGERCAPLWDGGADGLVTDLFRVALEIPPVVQ